MFKIAEGKKKGFQQPRVKKDNFLIKLNISLGKIMARGKYGGISQRPLIFPGHNFFLNFKRIYSFLSVPDAFASTMINDDM